MHLMLSCIPSAHSWYGSTQCVWNHILQEGKLHVHSVTPKWIDMSCWIGATALLRLDEACLHFLKA
jgi:hypothetical protein